MRRMNIVTLRGHHSTQHVTTLHVITTPYFSKALGQTPYTSLKPSITTVLGWPTLLRSTVESYGRNYLPELIKSNM